MASQPLQLRPNTLPRFAVRPNTAPLTPHEHPNHAAGSALWTPEVASLARSLIAPRQRRPILRFPASSVAEVSGKKKVNVLAVLARLDDFLRRKNMRAIDMFRDATINTSLGTTVDSAKRAGGRWQSGSTLRARAETISDMLSPAELSHFLNVRLSMRLTPAEVSELVCFLDVNGNGEVDPAELQQALRTARKWARRQRGESARSGRGGEHGGEGWRRLDRNARIARGVEQGGDPRALYIDQAAAAKRAAALRRRGIITPFAPAAPRGRKVDYRPRFGCGEQASRRDAQMQKQLGESGRNLRRAWKAPAYMRSGRTAGSTEHVLLRLDRAMRERGATATAIFASCDGGICDVLTPKELTARLTGRELRLGLDAAVVTRCVAALCSGGETHSAGGRAVSSHIDIGSFQLELKGARRHAASHFKSSVPPLSRDPDVIAALRGGEL